MEHIEEAGIHSGDSACAIPPFSLSAEVIKRLKEQTYALAEALTVRGLMNIQFAVKDGDIYVLEVNPRASRTVPFVSKATGLNLAQAAARVMVGKSLAEQGITREVEPGYVSVKESVFPFAKFPGVDIVLGPEMRSTGEVMGIARDFATAFAKSQIGASSKLPMSGTVFISVAARDRKAIIPVAKDLASLGYTLMSTRGTGAALAEHGIDVTAVRKIHEGRPNVLDHLANGAIALIVNTPSGKGARTDEGRIRASAVSHGVPCITTINGAKAAVAALETLRKGPAEVYALQDLLAGRSSRSKPSAQPAKIGRMRDLDLRRRTGRSSSGIPFAPNPGREWRASRSSRPSPAASTGPRSGRAFLSGFSPNRGEAPASPRAGRAIPPPGR